MAAMLQVALVPSRQDKGYVVDSLRGTPRKGVVHPVDLMYTTNCMEECRRLHGGLLRCEGGQSKTSGGD
ncbi:hypothetical protein CEXT_49401 [Caerostris extrusa]|uniref:Uncharacterized protein n=1 Tax=Caerostris extrusa TaxID=172846 RepID=A0AAV4XR58_CAEEX|nr:hypothetical protein CEXT_49401 [Caerostris extrusa]